MKRTILKPFYWVGIALFLSGIVIFLTNFLLVPVTPIQVYSEPILPPATRLSPPKRIQIGAIIDLPVETMSFGPKGWEVSDHAASMASTSALPGEHGNIVIYSHNLTRLFGKLSRVKVGDSVQLTTEDGNLHTYQVTQRMVVNPSEVASLLPTSTETLTLYTCSGLFDSKRLVVRAIPSISTQ